MTEHQKQYKEITAKVKVVENPISIGQSENFDGVKRIINTMKGVASSLRYRGFITENKDLELYSRLSELGNKLDKRILDGVDSDGYKIDGIDDYKHFFESYDVFKKINFNQNYDEVLKNLEYFLDNVDINKFTHVKSKEELEETKAYKEIEKKIDEAFNIEM